MAEPKEEEKLETHSSTFANGDVFDGYWLGDVPHGKGTYTSIKHGKKKTWTGIFNEGDPVNGKMTLSVPKKVKGSDITEYYVEYEYKGSFLNFEPADSNGESITFAEPISLDVYNSETYSFEGTTRFKGVFEGGEVVRGTIILPDGHIFEGECPSMFLSGNESKLTFPELDIKMHFTGKFNNGVYVEGKIVYKEGLTELKDFQGTLEDGKWHGHGTLTWKKENRFKYSYYTGTFVKGEVREGKLVYLDGSEYEGGFLNNQSHGQGTRIYPDDHKYYRKFTGEFNNGSMENGTVETVNGSIFTGQFTKGRPIHGEILYANKDHYIGGCGGKDCFMHGQGIITFHDHPLLISFKGHFIKSIPQRGCLSFKDGDVYTGDVNETFQPHGKGSCKFSSTSSKIPLLENTIPGSVEGEFQDGIMQRGTIRYMNSKHVFEVSIIYSGTFTDKFIWHGEGKLTDKHKKETFEGSFINGKKSKGIITLNSGDSYEGSFDDDENYQDAFGIYQFQTGVKFLGEFINGRPIKGKVRYNGNGVDDPSEVEYIGEVDEKFQRHGEGFLLWDAEKHPRNYQNYNGKFIAQHPIEGKLIFLDDSTFTGTMKNGRMDEGSLSFNDEYGVALYEGPFNFKEEKHGVGKRTFGDGRSFEGELQEDHHFMGIMKYRNGLKYKGKFYTEDKSELKQIPGSCQCGVENCRNCANNMKYVSEFGTGKGVIIFPDDTTYVHNRKSETGFYQRLLKRIENITDIVNDTENKNINECKQLSLWPTMPDVEPVLLPIMTKEKMSHIQEKGGVDALEESSDMRAKLIVNMIEVFGTVTMLLDKERVIDMEMRLRFPTWSLDKSDDVTKEFRATATRLKEFYQADMEENEILVKEWKENTDNLNPLKIKSDEYEKTFYEKESQCEFRKLIIENINKLHSLTEERRKTMDLCLSTARGLDIIRALSLHNGEVNPEIVELVINSELDELKPMMEKMEKSCLETSKVLEKLKRNYTDYQHVRAQIVEVQLIDENEKILEAVQIFSRLFNQFIDANSKIESFISKTVNVLNVEVNKFFLQRQAAKRALGERLLLSELHSSILQEDEQLFDKVMHTTIDDIELDVNKPDPLTGHRALGLAILHSKVEWISKLYEYGADLNLMNNKKHSYAFMAAMEAKKRVPELITALGKCGMDFNGIADANAKLTTLQLMAIQNRTDMVKLLIELGAKLRLETASDDGRIALHCACASNPPCIDTIITLLRNGSAVNRPDNELNTPLHLTTSPEVAEILVENGAFVSLKNSSKQVATFNLCHSQGGNAKELEKKLKTMEKLAEKRSHIKMDIAPLSKTSDNWINDHDHSQCLECTATFNTFSRRHHCRRCGLLLCNKCSPTRGIDMDNPKKKYRLCVGCFNLLSLKESTDDKYKDRPNSVTIPTITPEKKKNTIANVSEIETKINNNNNDNKIDNSSSIPAHIPQKQSTVVPPNNHNKNESSEQLEDDNVMMDMNEDQQMIQIESPDLDRLRTVSLSTRPNNYKKESGIDNEDAEVDDLDDLFMS